MPSSESLMYETRSKLLSSDPASLFGISPIAFSTASSASIPSVESLHLNQKIPLAADMNASILTSANAQTTCMKDMESSPELMVVMERLEAGLLSACKRAAMLLQEAIRQREEASLSNEVDTRTFNDSDGMNELRNCEEKEKGELEELENWYESQVATIEGRYAPSLEQCEKELDDYRSECFAKADRKEAELEKELKNDPPERAARIRSQVLERYHNKLVEGEHDIQLRRHAIKQKIQQEVKETEREYQKRRRGIEKGFTRASQSLKQELMERKRTIQATCMERREKARQAHSAAIESSRDILRETLTQVKELLRSYEEAYVDTFPISSVYFGSGAMTQTISFIIKKLHLFCDVRVHEQVKMMEAIRKEIDLFQNTCDELMTKAPEETEEPEDSAIRGDLFVQSSIRRQSELIGKVLLEIDDNSGGFHSKIATLKEQFAAEIRESTSQTTNPRGLWRRRENRKDIDVASVKKKYLGLVTESAQEELEDEYKRCVQDTVDFASNSARLFYREMAFRYWVLLKGYRDHHGEENMLETLAAVNQEILLRLSGEKKERTRLEPIDPSTEGESVKQKEG